MSSLNYVKLLYKVHTYPEEDERFTIFTGLCKVRNLSKKVTCILVLCFKRKINIVYRMIYYFRFVILKIDVIKHKNHENYFSK